MIRTRHIAMHLIFVLVHTHNSVRMFTCFRTSCVWPYIMDSRTSLIFNMRRESYESSSCVQSSHRHAWIGAASQMTRGTAGAYRSRSARAGSSHTEFAFCHHHGRPGDDLLSSVSSCPSVYDERPSSYIRARRDLASVQLHPSAVEYRTPCSKSSTTRQPSSMASDPTAHAPSTSSGSFWLNSVPLYDEH